MPNWVRNTLFASGAAETINKLQEQLNRPVSQFRKEDDKIIENVIKNPVFSFWNIVSPEDNMIKSWHESWYIWSLENWGCKWDASECECDQIEYPDREEKGVSYTFSTPWGPPNEAIINISKQYQEIEFNLVYEEETGWGGEVNILNGIERTLNEYNWRCCNCDYNTIDDVEYCEDCQSCPCPNCGSTESDTTCDAHTK